METSHTIELRPSTKHVVVSYGGVVLADSKASTVLLETRHQPRWYIPRDDVRLELLTATSLDTLCPWKGHASYFSYEPAGVDGVNLAWSYQDPLPEVAGIEGLVCFYSERTDLSVDGEPVD